MRANFTEPEPDTLWEERERERGAEEAIFEIDKPVK